MNPVIQLKQTTLLFLVAFGLAAFGPSPTAWAVSPAPDGGSPGFNTAEGQNALLSLTTGTYNTAAGYLSLRSNTTGQLNTATGAGTLVLNTADKNTATGAAALLTNTTGTQNTANGTFALFGNTGGSQNVANGNGALFSNTIGNGNTASGFSALSANSTGSFNTALGTGAGSLETTGSSNIFIGDVGGAGTSNVIAIGNSPVSGTSYNKFYAGAVYSVHTDSTTTLPVIIDNFGQLGTAPSAARFKKEIKPMDKASESVLALKPVTFQFKDDKTNRPQFGLIAEEVARVNPDLVVLDKNGEIYSVRYDQVNAMLLNEFLKEHHRVQEQERRLQEQETTIAQQRKDLEATSSELKKGMETLAARAKEQDAKIQKVSDQIELNAAAKQLAVSK